MRRLWLLGWLVIPVLVVTAQESGPPGFELWTPASLQLSDYSNESFLLVHREADGQVEWHETQIDVFFVQSGSATLLIGGTLLNGETVGPHEKRNGTIQGGVRRKISAGDVIRIPARVPHQVLLDGAHDFDYVVVKVKGY